MIEEIKSFRVYFKGAAPLDILALDEVDAKDNAEERRGMPPTSVELTDEALAREAWKQVERRITKKEFVDDAIINPAHYKLIPPGTYPKGLEYMDLMQFVLKHHTDSLVGHGLGQSFKYLLRAGKKDALEQDLTKAKWYLDYVLEYLKNDK